MLYPIFTLVMLTFVVMLVMLRVRIGALRAGAVSLKYFALMQGQEEVPDGVAKTTRHFANLCEVPVLFYTAGVMYIAMELSEPYIIQLAWTYVALRAIHSVIHLTYNNVLHRLLVFGFSNLCVLAMWISIVVAAGT